MDGLTLLDRLRDSGVRTPVLVLSALSSVDERIRGLRAGGDDNLSKPFATAELRARVEVLARRPPDREQTWLCCDDLVPDLFGRVARRGLPKPASVQMVLRVNSRPLSRKRLAGSPALAAVEGWGAVIASGAKQPSLHDRRSGSLRCARDDGYGHGHAHGHGHGYGYEKWRTYHGGAAGAVREDDAVADIGDFDQSEIGGHWVPGEGGGECP